MTFASVACSTNELPAAKTTSRHFEPAHGNRVDGDGRQGEMQLNERKYEINSPRKHRANKEIVVQLKKNIPTHSQSEEKWRGNREWENQVP